MPLAGKTLLFVLNPISGTQGKQGLAQRLEDFCQAHDAKFCLYETTGQDDAGYLRQELEKHAPDSIVAVGGDGTVSLVADVLAGTHTPLAIVPTGSGNGLSKDLGIAQTEEGALLVLANFLVMEMDVIEVNGKNCYHMADLGFNALVVKRYDELEGRGTPTYAWAAMQQYMGYTAPNVKVTSDIACFDGTAFMVVLANSKQFGSNAIINPDGEVDDGVFEVCVVAEFPKAAGLGILWKLYNGNIDRSVYTDIYSCRHVIINNPDGAELQIDGEPMGTPDRVVARIRPNHLRVVVPQ